MYWVDLKVSLALPEGVGSPALEGGDWGVALGCREWSAIPFLMASGARMSGIRPFTLMLVHNLGNPEGGSFL